MLNVIKTRVETLAAMLLFFVDWRREGLTMKGENKWQ